MKVLLFFFMFLDLLPKKEALRDLVTNFNQWYVNGGLNAIRVPFVAMENGMTTLNFKKHDEFHRKFGFSEQLLEKSKSIYEHCQKNLSTLTYTEFKMFDNIDQYEEINCSFQFWQWFGSGMDPFHYFEITEIKKLSKEKFEIRVGFAYSKNQQIERFIPVTVNLTNNEWKITNIGI